MTQKKVSYAKLYIDDTELTYQVRYSRKAKYLRLQINPSTGLEVVIPRRCKSEEAEKFILKKKDWILKHLNTVQVREEFLFLGNRVEVKQKFDLFLKKHRVRFQGDILIIESPDGSSENIDALYKTWLKHRAKLYLPERTKILAEKNNFSYSRITIRSQKTRWGSCSTSGSISLNYKLMKYRPEIIDYVIIHELCHTKQMNHSKKFWSLVERILPNYKELKRELKSHP